MTKKEWIDETRLRLLRIDETQKFHPVFVEKILNNLYNGLVHTYIKENNNNLRQFTKRYEIHGSTETTQDSRFMLDPLENVYFWSYPVEIIPIGDSKGAARHIRTQRDYGISFEPISDFQLQFIEGLDSDLLSIGIKYNVQKDRIVFFNIPVNVRETGAIVDLLVPFEAYSDNEEIHIPEGQEQVIIQAAVQFLSDERPVDLENDNSDQ